MDVEYMVFEDEEHGFTKYSNLVKALKRSAEFLVEKYNIMLHNGISKMIKLSIPIILLKRKNGTLHLKPCMENGTFELRYGTSRSSRKWRRQSTGSFVAKDIVRDLTYPASWISYKLYALLLLNFYKLQ